MDRDRLKKWILWLTTGWILIGLALFGLALGGVLAKQHFQYIFAGGFLLYAIIVTVLSRFLYNDLDK